MANTLLHSRDGVDISEIEAHVQLLSKQDEERNDLIKRMVQMISENQSEIHALKRDLSAQTDSRRTYQDRNEELISCNQSLKNELNKNPYVAVLVDGDGAIFEDAFLQDPATKATEASQSLKNHVRKDLRDSSLDVSEDVPIFARVFTHLQGLATTLVRCSVIDADDKFFNFTERFSNSCAEFDIINVGRGKENADSKVRTMLKHFVHDPRCKRIYFVACHDGGYFHDLKEYAGPHLNAQMRIVLVETTPAHPDLKALGLPMIQFHGLFRASPLSSKTDVPRKPQTSVAVAQASKAFVPAPSNVITSGNGGVSVSYQTSYANAGNAQAHRNLAITTSSEAVPKTVYLNKDGHRLDAPLKIPKSGPVQISYDRKINQIRPKAFCNAFYLNGRCQWKDYCDKEHEVKLTAKELAIHRFRARAALCYDGRFCAAADCLHGHHCPRSPHCDQVSCKWSDTMFGDLHLNKMEMEPVRNG